MSDYIDNIGSKESYEIFQHLINVFTTVNFTKSEYYLVLCMLKTLEKRENPSVEELACMANVSTASVSRFIKKCGFSSYTEFRQRVSSLTEVAYRERRQRFVGDDYIEIYPIERNLQATKSGLDYEKIRNTIKGFILQEQRIIIGQTDELAQFMPFHKDLFARNISHYFFYDLFTQQNLLSEVDDNTGIFFLTIGGVTGRQYIEMLNKAQKKGAKLYLLTQDEKSPFEDTAEIIYRYGIDGDILNGVYSLRYLSGIFSKVLMDMNLQKM